MQIHATLVAKWRLEENGWKEDRSGAPSKENANITHLHKR